MLATAIVLDNSICSEKQFMAVTYLSISRGFVSCTWMPHLGQSLLSSKCWTMQLLQTETCREGGDRKKLVSHTFVQLYQHHLPTCLQDTSESTTHRKYFLQRVMLCSNGMPFTLHSCAMHVLMLIVSVWVWGVEWGMGR